MTLSPEQQKIRSKALGGSEIAAVVGLNPYSTPLDVWASKTGRGPACEVTEPMILGTHLGPGIVKAYAEIADLTISHVGQYEQTMRHPDRELAVATPDGLIHASGRGSRVIATAEAKRPNPRNWGRWGEPGTDEIPPEVHCQITWSIGVVRGVYGDSVEQGTAIMPAYQMQVYPIQFDAEMFDLMYARAEQWWRDYVIADKEPPAVAADLDLLKHLHDKDNGSEIEVTDQLREMANRYDASRTAESVAGLVKQEASAQIRQLLGDAQLCRETGLKISWKNNKDKTTIDYKRAAIDAGAQLEPYTETKPGPRVLRVTFPKGKK